MKKLFGLALILVCMPISLLSKPASDNTGMSKTLAEDEQALRALYGQCNGVNWTKQTYWLTGSVDTWYGVYVEGDRVVGLNLADYSNSVGLTGTLPPEFFTLTELRFVMLGNNQLTGNLTDEWTALTKLEILYLDHNQFTGALPVSWSVMANLKLLKLRNNLLSGTLPANWSSLVNLEMLDLGENGFSGELPADWGQLSKLAELDLDTNTLTGNLPAEWSNLTLMKYLLLAGNQFSGVLPSDWSSMTKLETLALSSNQFSGELPAIWSSMANLKYLQLDYNQLSGPVPESWLGMINLKSLTIEGNQISGLPDFADLQYLDVLRVQYNKLDFGDIEPNIGGPNTSFTYSPQGNVGAYTVVAILEGQEFRFSWNTPGLSNLYQWYKASEAMPGATGPELIIPGITGLDAEAYSCKITNSVATGLTLSSEAVVLSVIPNGFYSDRLALEALYNKCNGANWTKKNNWMTGEPLQNWEGVTVNVETGRVTGLNLSDWVKSVGLTGSLPTELAWLTKLESLELANNQLSGALPENLSALVNLRWLDLSMNKFTGTLPECWSAWSKIQNISLGNNQLTGELPSSWSSMASLTNLYVFNNQLTGILPDSWSAMSNLQTCYLNGNQLSGSLPASWSSMTLMSYLFLAENQLSGSLPESWSNMKNLLILGLGNNKFTGNLPASWSVLTNLQRLYLNQNQLEGDLPTEWASMGNLLDIYLWSNKLNGTLPPSWSSMVNLQNLALQDNRLNGILPESWSSLVNLKQLYLANNLMDGTLPGSWSNMTNLEDLVLHTNAFTGPLPESWSALSKLRILSLDLNKFAGDVPTSWTTMVSLEELSITTNQFSGLPDLSSLTNLKRLWVTGNNLDFGDIEPNVGVAQDEFTYGSQAAVGTAANINLFEGQEFRVSVSVGGSSNIYQWCKNGIDILSANTAEFLIPAISMDDSGVYTCRISNSMATELTLWSNPVTLVVAEGGCLEFSVNISGISPVYLGYAPMATSTLKTKITGGTAPFAYLWSNGATGSYIQVSPSVNTDYMVTVTDAHGCQATANFIVDVIDIRCGSSLDKVLVCTGGKKAKSNCTNPMGVAALLARGGSLGNCQKDGFMTSTEAPAELSLNLYPNPSSGKVMIDLTGIPGVSATLIVKDLLGRTILFKELQTSYSELREEISIDQAGIYLVCIQTELETLTQKLIISR
jgi:Leucine-rich repeat (LRR) protein